MPPPPPLPSASSSSSSPQAATNSEETASDRERDERPERARPSLILTILPPPGLAGGFSPAGERPGIAPSRGELIRLRSDGSNCLMIKREPARYCALTSARAEEDEGGSCRVRHRRSVPITSAACCGPRALLKAREDFAADRIDAGRAEGRSRTIRSATWSRMQEDVGTAVRDRRRVPPRVLAHGLHLRARRDQQGRGRPRRALPQPRGRHRLHARRAQGRRQDRPARADLRRATSSSSSDTVNERHAEAHDPVAEHGPLPRRRGGDRPGGVSRQGRVLDRPDRRLRQPGAHGPRPRLHLPPVRRHEPRVPQRPEPAQDDDASAARTPSTCTRPTSATSTRRWRTSPDGITITTHMCRGNFRSSWVAEGGYDFVAEALFGELGRGRLLPRVRRRALGRLRAAALRARRASRWCSGW